MLRGRDDRTPEGRHDIIRKKTSRRISVRRRQHPAAAPSGAAAAGVAADVVVGCRLRRLRRSSNSSSSGLHLLPLLLCLSAAAKFCVGTSPPSSTSTSSSSSPMKEFSEAGSPSPRAASESERRHYGFDELSALSRRLDLLEGEAPETMASYYDPYLRSFCNQPGRMYEHRRVCVTSSCYALLTLTLSSDVYDSFVSYREDGDDNGGGGGDEEGASQSKNRTNTAGPSKPAGRDRNRKKMIPVRQVVRTLLASEWRLDDLFQVALITYTILKLDDPPSRPLLRSVLRSDPSGATAAKVRGLLQAVLDARPHRRSGTQQVHSDYIYYQVCKVLAQLQDNGGGGTAVQQQQQQQQQRGIGDGKGGETVEECKSGEEASTGPTDGKGEESHVDRGDGKEDDDDDDEEEEEEEEEIGLGGLPVSCIPEGASSEVFWALLRCAEVSSNELCRQLAYRTAGDYNSFDVIRLAYSLLTYITATASISGIAGTELVAGEGPAPETKVAPLNRRLVKAALAAFFAEQNKDGLWMKGQPIYKSFETGKGRSMGSAFVFPVNTVGSLLCALDAEDFRPHLEALERTLEWIEGHQSLEIITDYCDRKTGQCYGKPLKGWSSPHLPPDDGPQAWPTAQVLKCVSWMKRTVRQLMHNDVLEEFSGIAFSKNGIQRSSWDRLLDCDLGDPSKVTKKGDEGCRTLKSVLEERVVEPFAISFDNPSYGAAYSAILFGPPGTAKTTICEALAQRMGYDFCVIDTAVFLADGLSNVSARIRYVFKRLMALRRCIILFDEIEEFALDRETPGLSMESRMLTTGMLTAINDLRRNKQSLFFVATNRLRAFDSAITRPGRFDMQLFVGTPNLNSRICQFRQSLAAVHADKNVKDGAIASYRQFLERVWTKDSMYMNYLEGLQFASACADLVAANIELTEFEMSTILNRQVAVMTVRGSAREDYVEMMGLSRF